MAQLDKIRLSGTTYDIIDATAIHSLDGYWTTGETTNAITAATNALAESIAEQGYQTSGDVQNAISGKADSSAVTQEISAAVSGKANSADVITSLSGVVNSVGIYGITYVKGGTETTTNIFNIGNGLKQGQIDRIIEVDTSIIAQKSDIPAVSGYADAVKYDSTAQEVKFYHGGTGGTEVYSFDASPFLIDGMIESVVITSITSGSSEVEVLEITWNSAAGGQVTDIPLSEIFDASNYYTTAQTNSAIEAATSGKADTTAVTQAISEAVSGKADTTAVTQSITEAVSGKANISDVVTSVTVSDYNNTVYVNCYKGGVGDGYIVYRVGSGLTLGSNYELSVDTNTIQEKLTSGTNIKTVNGNSLLGSGDLVVDTGLHAEVSGTTLVFS